MSRFVTVRDLSFTATNGYPCYYWQCQLHALRQGRCDTPMFCLLLCAWSPWRKRMRERGEGEKERGSGRAAACRRRRRKGQHGIAGTRGSSVCDQRRGQFGHGDHAQRSAKYRGVKGGAYVFSESRPSFSPAYASTRSGLTMGLGHVQLPRSSRFCGLWLCNASPLTDAALRH